MIEEKIIIIGESGVGKTSLINRYAHGKFQNVSPTALVEDVVKETSVQIDKTVVKMKLVFWDTAGTEKFLSMSKLYFQNVSAVILVFAINDANSFRELEKWQKIVEDGIETDPIIYILGNKVDLADQ